MKHGVYVREQKTSVSTPVVAESGVPFVVGAAPVHSAESPAALFTPVLCTDWEDAVKKLGYSDDWKTYTIWRSRCTAFRRSSVSQSSSATCLIRAPTRRPVAGAKSPFRQKQAKLPFDAILSSLVVKTASSSESPLVKRHGLCRVLLGRTQPYRQDDRGQRSQGRDQTLYPSARSKRD